MVMGKEGSGNPENGMGLRQRNPSSDNRERETYCQCEDQGCFHTAKYASGDYCIGGGILLTWVRLCGEGGGQEVDDSRGRSSLFQWSLACRQWETRLQHYPVFWIFFSSLLFM